MKFKTIQKLIVITFSLILISSSAFSVENNQLADDVFQPAEYKNADQIKIENIVTRQLSNPLYSTGYGISVRNMKDGTIVFESNAQDSMMPASLTKIYTAASSALTLDLDAKFVTKVKYFENKIGRAHV